MYEVTDHLGRLSGAPGSIWTLYPGFTRGYSRISLREILSIECVVSHVPKTGRHGAPKLMESVRVVH